MRNAASGCRAACLVGGWVRRGPLAPPRHHSSSGYQAAQRLHIAPVAVRAGTKLINATPAPKTNPLPNLEPDPGPDPNAAVREDSVGHGAREWECRRCEAVAGGGRWWTGAARAARGDSATGWGGGCGTELARGLMAASGPTP